MRRVRRPLLPVVVAALAVLVAFPSLAHPVDAATSTWAATCETRIRVSSWLSSRTLRIVDTGTKVTAVATVTGGSYRAFCGGAWVSGSGWLKITAINGKSTKTLFGRSYVYAAAKLFKSVATMTTTSTSTTSYLSNCAVRLRSSDTTMSTTRSIIDTNTVVAVSGQVTGGSWSANCGTNVSGNTWFKITAVNGKSVKSLYGISVVYAATGLFRKASTSGFREGIDVSHWQSWIDWAKVTASGKSFVFAKATEGIGWKDASYDRNKAGAMAVGLKFGAYHFARPGRNNPVEEADWFVKVMGLQRGMLLPVLDLEETGGLGPTALTNWTKAWLKRVHERTGARAIIYTSPAFWREHLNDSRWFADNGYAILWVAHWGVSKPSVMADNWGGRSWTFWQYTSNGSVPGIDGRVDLNRYRFSTFEAVTY
ncbi:MAG TPA: glycoside hydrolase family 25 protein [Candidatus Binatia bacterium]|nr:glycoside hydrolase family 25 protein [Candidatus Binatia bacterium]